MPMQPTPFPGFRGVVLVEEELFFRRASRAPKPCRVLRHLSWGNARHLLRNIQKGPEFVYRAIRNAAQPGLLTLEWVKTVEQAAASPGEGKQIVNYYAISDPVIRELVDLSCVPA
jgi:hypothetical protein